MTQPVSGGILERLLPYVPPHWVLQAVSDPDHTLAGRQDRLQAAVLFVDISGFTPIAEALSRRGREGIEELVALLDRYLTSMSEPVVAFGGQVAKYAGDSLIALFPRGDVEEAHLGSALLCALRMREAMSDFSRLYTSAGTFPLQCKIGISEGSVFTTTVGDAENGMLPVFAGRSLVRAMLAEDHAAAGEIVVDAVLTGRLPGHLDVGESRGTFRLIDGATDVPTLPVARPVEVSALEPGCVERLVCLLAPYLPFQVIERFHQEERGIYGEYRRVTVMFVRFEGLDYDAVVEEGPSVGEVLQTYCTTMRDYILRYGGRLNEVDITTGGGILVAFFGAPAAHEDNELRAVSCAWEMQQAIVAVRETVGQEASKRVCSDLRQCVSISSGTLFVGDVGGQVRRTYAAVGDEVNLASRLSDRAEWGETLVTGWIRRRTDGRFEFKARGEVEIRGKVERVPLALLRASRSLGKGNSLLSRLLNRRFLVGRATELAVLSMVATRARGGEPQLLFLSGEAGVGKSRLVGELVHQWAELGGAVWAADCTPAYGGLACSGLIYDGEQGSPTSAARDSNGFDGGCWLDPWIALLMSALGLEDGDSPERCRNKIESVLPAGPLSVPSLAVFCDRLLASDAAANSSLISFTEGQRDCLYQALVSQVRVTAQKHPLLLVLEGVHQLDLDSWALLRDLISSVPALPLLMCVTGRPTGTPEPVKFLSRDAQVTITRLCLEPLAEADSLFLAEHLMRDVGLQTDLAPALVRQARGNPLYLQEMIHALAATECPVEALAQGLIVPDRIAHTVLAQFDPLGEDYKLTLRIAAVIGQTFSLQLLRSAHPVPISRRELALRLARLERMHIVRLYHLTVDADSSDVYYRFRHALTQRVIYASLLRADRERFHLRVGQAMEQVFGESSFAGEDAVPVRLETSYGLLADHFQRGNVLSKAIVYALLAGQCAARDRAVREALTHYSWTQDLLQDYERAVPDHPVRCMQGIRISLYLGRGSVYYQLMDVVKAREDYKHAYDLAGDLADIKSQADALLLLGDIAMRQADYIHAQTLIHQAIQRLSVLGDSDLLARAWLLLSRIAAWRGGLEEATYYVALAAGKEPGDQPSDPGCVQAIGIYKEWLETIFLTNRSFPALESECEERARASEDVACLLWLAEIAVRKGRWGDALGLVRQGMALGWAAGTPLDVADAKSVLALILMQVGVYQEAGDYLDEALTTFAEADWMTGLVDGYWLSGEILLALGRHELAAERFDQALRLGRETHTIQAVVRALIGLGKLAAAREQWREGQRLCTEARAQAMWAKLGASAISARLGLARVYLECQEWQLAYGQAKHAHDLGDRLSFPGDVLVAVSMLGEALVGLGRVDHAQQCFQEAYSTAVQLADTLPFHYARAFWSKPSVRALRDYVVN